MSRPMPVLAGPLAIEGDTMRVSGPVTGGSKGWAFGGPVADLAALGYRQEEYFLEGEAARYGPVQGTDLGRDGRWQVEPVETTPFKTPPRGGAAERPCRFQRDGRRPVEQRLGRVREFRGRRQPGGLRKRLRLRRRLRPAGRHSRAARQSAGPAGVGSGALRIAVDPQRRLLVRHLHPGGQPGGARPAPRDTRRHGGTRRPATDRPRRLPIGGPAGLVPRWCPADHGTLRRLLPHAVLRRGHAARGR